MVTMSIIHGFCNRMMLMVTIMISITILHGYVKIERMDDSSDHAGLMVIDMNSGQNNTFSKISLLTNPEF